MKHIVMMHNIKKHHDFEHHVHDVLKDADYEVVYTNSIADSQKRIKKQEEKARFYIVGGDGTMHNLLQALVHTEHDAVLIPLGTGNDFCRMISKEKDPVKLLKKSLTLESKKVDTVKINDRYFMNSACFGVDAMIANRMPAVTGAASGAQSKNYVGSLVKNLFDYEFDNITVLSEGKTIYQGAITLCTFNNGQYYGGGFRVTPLADICDGYFNVRIADKMPKAKMPYMIARLVMNKLDGHKLVHDFKLKRATLICNNVGNLDGERYQDESDIYEFEIQSESLNLVIYD